MTKLWIRELKHYTSLIREQKLLWLSRLLFLISMFARDTYELGTESVSKPKELRHFNELLHRISSKQLDTFLNETGIPDNQFFEMISEEIEWLSIDIEGLIEKLR